jgi:hypothetical protein
MNSPPLSESISRRLKGNVTLYNYGVMGRVGNVTDSLGGLTRYFYATKGNLAREISLYLLRKLTDMSNEEIARYFGIGYTAVSHAAARLIGRIYS